VPGGVFLRRAHVEHDDLADASGIRTATWAVAALTAASGLYAWARMYETHPTGRAVVPDRPAITAPTRDRPAAGQPAGRT